MDVMHPHDSYSQCHPDRSLLYARHTYDSPSLQNPYVTDNLFDVDMEAFIDEEVLCKILGDYGEDETDNLKYPVRDDQFSQLMHQSLRDPTLEKSVRGNDFGHYTVASNQRQYDNVSTLLCSGQNQLALTSNNSAIYNHGYPVQENFSFPTYESSITTDNETTNYYSQQQPLEQYSNMAYNNSTVTSAADPFYPSDVPQSIMSTKSQWSKCSAYETPQEISFATTCSTVIGNTQAVDTKVAASTLRNKAHAVNRKMIRNPHPYIRKRRKPREGRSGKRSRILWKFLLDLLISGKHPDYITWVEKNKGTFKFLNSGTVAALWGKFKNKPNMTYETLSRSMRFYYKNSILRKVLKQRLVYQFVNMDDVNAYIDEYNKKKT